MTKAEYDAKRKLIYSNNKLSVKERVIQLGELAGKRKQDAQKIGIKKKR